MTDRDDLLRPRAEESGAMEAVASFQDPLRAQMARGLLQGAGIDCFLQGEHVNQLLSAAFRARLRVRAEDAAEARDILREVDGDCVVEVPFGR